MKGRYFSLAFCLNALIAQGQVTQDSMPVSKPPVTDKEILHTPVSPGDNMPIATPDGTKISGDTLGARREFKKRPVPNKRKKRG